MWLFSQRGFFSAVEHFSDKGIIHVRARFEGDLERLCLYHKIDPNIEVTPKNDYPYRMDFSRDDWKKIVSREAEEIDYANFKSKVHDGTTRDAAYLRIWSELRKAQK